MITNFVRSTLYFKTYVYNKFTPVIQSNLFHTSRSLFGFEDFYDSITNSTESIQTGRSWTVPDLRRKV